MPLSESNRPSISIAVNNEYTQYDKKNNPKLNGVTNFEFLSSCLPVLPCLPMPWSIVIVLINSTLLWLLLKFLIRQLKKHLICELLVGVIWKRKKTTMTKDLLPKEKKQETKELTFEKLISRKKFFVIFYRTCTYF